MRGMHRLGAAVAALATATGVLVAGAVPAQASVVRYGTVVYVPDGDTIDVDVDGSVHRVRFAAVQAMEMHTYLSNLAKADGECHAVAATARLRQILGGRRVSGGELRTDGARVRLTARDARSSSFGRQVRFVAVRRNGMWQDVGAMLVHEGHVVPAYNAVEYAQNKRYRVLALKAARAHVGVWNRDSCGTRPAATAALAVTVQWDAPGDDRANLNGEYVRIANRGRSPLALGGWWVRDSGLRRFTLPSSARIAPGGSVVVHVGRGSAHRSGSTLHLYWGEDAPVFQNVTAAPSYLGDGAHLFDPRGNLRAWKQYGTV